MSALLKKNNENAFRYLVLMFLGICLIFGRISVMAQNKLIIPQPEKFTAEKGNFLLTKEVHIAYQDTQLQSLAAYTASSMHSLTGLALSKSVSYAKGNKNTIYLVIDHTATTGKEGYELHAQPDQVTIRGSNAQGLFYGVQTLLQLIPSDGKMTIPCVLIKDEPRFGWRGVMLDVSRHFFPVSDVKKLIDEMVVYKFNLLHLHLSDDQGWRVEIKSLPELTKVGAWRVPRTGSWGQIRQPEEGEEATYGGFYTQDEIRDIVKYAASRYVQVLPEIDVPGHSLAAIATYPNLSSTKLPYKVNPGSPFYTIDDNSLCPGQEATFEFLDKVFTEIAALFPFEYIHIGGDECYKGFWKKCAACQQRMKDNNLKDENELQSYFVHRVEKILESKGKKLLGWDEILEGGLAPNATVMSWRGMEGGITAAKAKHHVVMSPADHVYFDLYQGDVAIEPQSYSMLLLRDVYSFEPVPDSVEPSYILGGQGNLWTENIPTWRHAEYMLWPRALALSEVLWSPKSSKNWDSFIQRTEEHFKRMNRADINYAVSMYDAVIQTSNDEKNNLQIKLDKQLQDLRLYYTFDNTFPDQHSSQYKAGEILTPPPDAKIFRVVTYRDGKVAGRIITADIGDLEKRVVKK